MKRSTVIRLLLTVGGGLMAGVAVLLSEASTIHRLTVICGAVLPVVGLLWGSPRMSRHRVAAQQTSEGDNSKQDFEVWREQVYEQLRLESERLDTRWKQLNARTLQYRELLEYPADPNEIAEQQIPELSVKDREVSAILEQEAARVYEKVRANGYTVQGRLNVDLIRDEVLSIITKVARVYQPNSTNPLLETSFEQLARSASRVCLQALVLVEQLPLDVQHYNINQLYGYVRKGINAWGHWQTVAPWVTHLSRGLYAGRLASSTNPVTLGTWWLATEIGRQGAKKLVENVVDRHAVAFFNDVVRLIGTEVACVFGPGIRQRDPAWILGAELTELMHRFPLSRDSLSEALRQVTALPLRSEYDRIYLYRCLAQHQPSGFRLADPAVLTRDEREEIARRLEQFFQQFIHGARSRDVTNWCDSVHERLDLRLKLSDAPATAKSDVDQTTIVSSVHRFLTGVAGLSSQEAWQLVSQQPVVRSLPADARDRLAADLSDSKITPFEPPDLDPADPLTDVLLRTIAACCAEGSVFDDQTDTMLMETGRYFRRSSEEMRTCIDAAWTARLRQHFRPDAPGAAGQPAFARSILQQLRPNEMVTGIYQRVTCEPELPLPGNSPPDLCVVCFEGIAGRRVLLLSLRRDTAVLWESGQDLQVERDGGLVVDNCLLKGGQWSISVAPSTTIILTGRFGRGGYDKWFRPLL